MTMSASTRAALVDEASQTVSIPAIYYLAQLYRRYGRYGALEVTEAISEGTDSSGDWTEQRFGGFISGSTSEGFNWKLSDPNRDNAQTGHFFSFVVWARDGMSWMEWSVVIGHELLLDHVPGTDITTGPAQAGSGVPYYRAFSEIVSQVDHRPDGTIDYLDLTADLAAEGWSTRTLIPWLSNPADITVDPSGRFRVPARVGDEDYYTGNSLQDLRCSVAGVVLGQIIHAGGFVNAEGVAAWIERNVMDRSLAAAGLDVTPLPLP